jgi:acyl-CoA dehydrogenase
MTILAASLENNIPMNALSGEPTWMTEEARIFRKSVREFIARDLAPCAARWDEQGRVDRDAWARAGELGMLLPALPEAYGGCGGDFSLEAVVIEELSRAGLHLGFGIQAIVARYILAYGDEEQKRRWLPGMARGELIAAIAMTEANAGSDLLAMGTSARRDGDHFRVDGSKTFITNGADADLVCLAVRTDFTTAGPRCLSMLVVETKGLHGYQVGRSASKIGRHAQNTCELFFEGVRVPAANLLGSGEGRGFFQMMEQLPFERLTIALGAVATAERAVDITTRYVKERKAFGKCLFDLQNTRFKLAECKTETHIGRVFLDNCVRQFLHGKLDDVTAAMAKYWATDLECRVVDACVQLHGGYGYMKEFEIARMWADSRVERIYAGSNEVMKEIVGWSL